MADGRALRLHAAMKHHPLSQHQNQSRMLPGPILPTADIDHAVHNEDIARRAYFRYVERGSQPGHDVRDWLLAEAGIRAEQLNRA